DIGARLDPAVGEIEAVERRPHLYRDRPIIDGARPYRVARLPGRHQHVRQPPPLAGGFETHHERVALTRDVECDLAFAEPHGSPLPRARPAPRCSRVPADPGRWPEMRRFRSPST